MSGSGIYMLESTWYFWGHGVNQFCTECTGYVKIIFQNEIDALWKILSMEAKWSSVFMQSADLTPGLALHDSPPSCVAVLQPWPEGFIPEVKSSISVSSLLTRVSSLACCFVFRFVWRSEFQKPKQWDNTGHFAIQAGGFLHASWSFVDLWN